MDQFQTSTVTGCMESLAMRHRAHVIGLAGMEQRQNNSASVDYSTMNKLTAAIGPK